MSQTVHVPSKADVVALKRKPVVDLEHCTHLLTVPQAAHYLNLNPNYLRDHAAANGGFKVGRGRGEWRFRAQDLPGVRREETAE